MMFRRINHILTDIYVISLSMLLNVDYSSIEIHESLKSCTVLSQFCLAVANKSLYMYLKVGVHVHK